MLASTYEDELTVIILEETIEPLIEYFVQTQKISRWFFIRYYDPKSHLRIRINLNNINDYSEILEKINEALQEHVENGEISNIIFDTYNRELERYGENTSREAETLFDKNSEFALQYLHFDDEEKIIISLFYIDETLNKLHLTIKEKLDWIKDFNTAFKQEFTADKKFNSQLDKKYRDFKPKYVAFLQSEEFLEERSIIISNIEEGSSTLQNILQHNESNSLEVSLQNFFQSIFHMNINRLFVSNQRLFELVIYDYLLRYYKSLSYLKTIG